MKPLTFPDTFMTVLVINILYNIPVLLCLSGTDSPYIRRQTLVLFKLKAFGDKKVYVNPNILGSKKNCGLCFRRFSIAHYA